ncbi:MAG: hypothetical protein ACREYD_12345 [Casimicrobiaceae bacterium]
MSRFNLLVVEPEDYVNYSPFIGVARLMASALRRLGHEVRVAGNEFLHDATNMIFGAHHLAPDLAAKLPSDTIVYNTEQLRADGALLEALRPFVARFELWDPDLGNVDAWRALGLCHRVCYVQPGYVPESSTVDLTTPADIDVLFFGKVNPRRMVVLDAIARAGIALHVADGIYQADRDALAARARIVLNVHAADDSTLEMARIAYALANRRAVVTELGRGACLDPDLRGGVVAGSSGELPALCRSLLADEPRRLALAEEGFRRFSRRDLTVTVRGALAEGNRS